MAKPSASNAISKMLFTLNMKNGHRSEQYLTWAIDDYLADLTQQKKSNPPPAEVMPQLHELGKLYAEEVIKSEPFTDILGRTYMDLVSQGGQKMLAQYFTPEPVARLMSQITFTGNIRDPFAGDLFRVCEPCCGSGVMLLQACRTLTENEGWDVLGRVSLTAIDLDALCAKMTAVQLLANGMIHRFHYGELVVLSGNSLGDPTKLETVVHAYHASQVGKSVSAQHPARVRMIREVVEARPDLKKRHEEQLSLF